MDRMKTVKKYLGHILLQYHTKAHKAYILDKENVLVNIQGDFMSSNPFNSQWL